MAKNEMCPVCDWEIKDDAREVKAGSKTITVCCEECERTVQANPGKYA